MAVNALEQSVLHPLSRRPVTMPEQPSAHKAGPEVIKFGSAKEVLFGLNALPQEANWRGTFISNEGSPRRGGLGDVTDGLPPAAIRRGIDLRPIVPYRALTAKINAEGRELGDDEKLKANEGFKKTNTTIYVKAPVPRVFIPFEVWQQNINGVWNYALRNDKVFGNDPEIDTIAKASKTLGNIPSNPGPEDVLKDADYREFMINMLFAKAASVLTVMLDSTKDNPVASFEQTGRAFVKSGEKGEPLERFQKAPNLLVLNDWGPAGAMDYLEHHAPDFFNSVNRVYFFHNEYAKLVPTSLAEKVFDLPRDQHLYPTPQPNGFKDGAYNSIESGVAPNHAHAVLIDPNYAQKLMTQPLEWHNPDGKPAHVGELLRQQFELGRLATVHHGVFPSSSPFESEVRTVQSTPHVLSLTVPLIQGKRGTIPTLSIQYKPLDESVKTDLAKVSPSTLQSLEDKPSRSAALNALVAKVTDWKAQNKEAFQDEVGLPVGKDNVLFIAAGRPDPRQKGYWSVLHEIEQFLVEHPKAQIAFFTGSHNDPITKQFIQRYAKQFNANSGQWEYTNPPKDAAEEAIREKVGSRIAYITEFSNYSKELLKRGMAAADFPLANSVYEPFGIYHLEAMTNAGVPVASWEDGIRSTTANRHQKTTITVDGQQQEVPLIPNPNQPWEYASTAIFLDPAVFNVKEYRYALSQWEAAAKAGHPVELRSLTSTLDHALTVAMDEAYKLATTPERKHELDAMRLSVLKYVMDHHTWDAAVQQYYPTALEIAANASGIRPNTSRLNSFA